MLERRRLFPYLTVGQNVLLGAYPPGARARRATTRAEVEALFPLLQARWGQPAHTLSGPARPRPSLEPLRGRML